MESAFFILAAFLTVAGVMVGPKFIFFSLFTRNLLRSLGMAFTGGAMEFFFWLIAIMTADIEIGTFFSENRLFVVQGFVVVVTIVESFALAQFFKYPQKKLLLPVFMSNLIIGFPVLWLNYYTMAHSR